MTRRIKSNKKYNYLTILRAIAFFGVSLFHTYSHFVPGGYLAVIIFLVLSGFLTVKTADFKNQELKTKLKTKFINILSPVYLIMAISLIFSFIFARTIFDDSIKSAIPVALNIENIRRILAGDDYFNQLGNFNMFLHMWYVSLYMQFIAIFFTIDQFLRNPKKDNKRILVYGSLTLISFISMFIFAKSNADITRIYYAIDTRFSAFSLGALAYLINKKIDKTKLKLEINPKIAIIILGLLVIVPFFVVDGKDIKAYRGFFVIYTIAVALLITFLYNFENLSSSNKQNRHGFIYKFLLYIGERSFYLYLWQYIVQIFVVYFSPGLMDNILLNLLIQFFIIIILSEFTYHLLKTKSFKKYILSGSLLVFVILSITSLVLGNSKNDEINNLRNDIKQSQEKIDQANKEIIEKNKNRKEKIEEKNIPKTKKLENNFKEKAYDDFDFSEKELEFLKNLNITAVGDSVIINADSYIRKFIPNFYLDGKVGRDMVSGPDILSQIKNNYGLADIILISLGSNGSANEADLEKIMQIADGRDVYFINTSHTQSYMEYVNKNLASFTEKNDKAHLVDWREFVKDRPDLLAPDRTHPNVEGSDDFAKLIMRKILNVNRVSE
ncbi:acyltransferase family protein [Anaerococcus sp. mt242]|uniref:acyltransferase family protein n=1 Tax=Anaerococcus sp. mt242 TaxID=2661917 RepID=UPI001933F2E4|nr:acyltransferase family protein [Anaerococcus sp. mt242]MBM0046779.1 acyltransferase family protein [Anaerococcus sp. mt242]